MDIMLHEARILGKVVNPYLILPPNTTEGHTQYSRPKVKLLGSYSCKFPPLLIHIKKFRDLNHG